MSALSRELTKRHITGSPAGNEGSARKFEPITEEDHRDGVLSPQRFSPFASLRRASQTPWIGLTVKKIANERIVAKIVFCNREKSHTMIEPMGCQVFKTPDGLKVISSRTKGKIGFGYKGSFEVVQNVVTKEMFFRRDVRERSSPGCCGHRFSTPVLPSPFVC